MLDYNEINRAIAELEAGATSFSSCGKLADLYIVRDHADNQRDSYGYEKEYSQAISRANTSIGVYGDSEFLKAISSKDNQAVWKIMDDLMDTLRVVNIKVYDSVLRKVMDL